MPFVSAIEFLVKFFKFHDFCGQLHIGIIMHVWHILTVWIALRALPYEGLFWSPILLLLMSLCDVMGVVRIPMLLA